MPLKIQDAGTLRTIKRLWIKQAGVLRRIRTLKVMDGDELRTVGVFSDPLAVAVPPGVTGVEFAPPGTPVLVSTSAGAVVIGGIGPFSYSWARVSGEVFTIGSPSSASTSFSKTLVGNVQQSGTYRVTVTDSVGDTASADTVVTLICNSIA